MSSDFRQKIFSYRSYTPIPFLIVMVIFANPTLLSLVVGFIIALVGELIRIWGVGYAGSETRTTGPVGGSKLVTNGPYAYVRNPLYIREYANLSRLWCYVDGSFSIFSNCWFSLFFYSTQF